MEIMHVREYKNLHTDGDIFINDDGWFCYCLEDIGRPVGVKIPGETCIPEGVYDVAISRSNRWDKDMLILFTDGRTHEINVDGVKYTGVRPHGGNGVKDTHGCPLLAFNSDHSGRIWKRASDALFDMVKVAIDAGESVTWTIISE